MASDAGQAVQESFREWLNRGHDLAWAGQWKEAAAAYQRAIEIHGTDPMAHTDLGLALFESGEQRQALAAYQQAFQLSPTDTIALQKIAEIHALLGEPIQAASTYMMLADSHMQARQPAQAVRAWQQVVRYDPHNRVAYRRLADAYRRGRRNDLAAQAALALARVHAEAGEEREATEQAQRALELHPDFGPARHFLATLQGAPSGGASRPAPRRGGAATPLDFEGEAPAPDRPHRESGGSSPTELAQQRALARLAEAFFDGDSVDLTLEALKATAIDLQTRGLVEEAARAFEEIEQAGGGSDDVYYTLGTLYQTMLRFEDAIRQFRRVTEAPDYATAAHFAIGQCYGSQGRMDEAQSCFLDALGSVDMDAVEQEQADEIIRLYEALADSYEAQGELEQADQVINMLANFLHDKGWESQLRALRARLGSVSDSHSLGELLDSTESEAVLNAIEASQQYQTRGQHRAAIEELYWALPLSPHYLPLHIQLAEIFLADDRPEDAVTKLVTVAELYATRSKPTQAIRTLQRALEISPADQAVRSKLIDFLMLHGEIDEALDHYLQLADGFYQLAQGERAIDKLYEALRLAPRGNPSFDWALKIQRRLADIHMQRLDWRRAVAAFEGIYALRPQDMAVVRRLADLYYRLGAEERALALVENAASFLLESEGAGAMLRFMEGQVEQRPDDIALVRSYGEMLAHLGDSEGAAAQWERAVERLVRKGERTQGAALLRRIIGLHPRNEARYRAMLQAVVSRQ